MQKSRLMGTTGLLSIIATGFIGSLPALAQEAEQTGSRGDTVIVTATRRAEDVQDTPINIAALGAEQIEEQGFGELADVLAYVPGINIVDRGGRQGNPIIVRGLNADPVGSGDGNNDGGGTVATYLGEIPIYVDLKLNDLERVEVLLGPQGTLYGAGTLGGAIRYIPKKPDFSGDLFAVRVEGYQYSEAESLSSDVGFTFNKSLGDTFAIRGSVDYLDDSGYIDYPFVVTEPGVSQPDPDFSDPAARAANFSPVIDADGEETLSGRLAARWSPTSYLDGTLTYYFQNSEIGGRSVSSMRSTVPAGQYESGSRVVEPNSIENQLIALEITADLGFAELTSATGLSKFTDDGQRDQTDLLITLEYSYESFPTFTAFTHEEGEENRFNEEIRLVSTSEGPLSWIVGAFYNKFDLSSYSAEYTPGYADFAGFDRPDDLEYFSQTYGDLTEQALYGEIGYDITDKLSVTIGGRYYDYELETYNDVDFPLFDPDFVASSVGEIESLLKTDFAADSPNGTEKTGQADDGFLSKINIAYKYSEDVLLYATVSEGYRIGNSNGLGTCTVYDPAAPVQQGACALEPGQVYAPGGPGDVSVRDETQYGPDTTTNYELGFKSEWNDGSLIVNGTVYYIEWTDPQLSSATVNASIPITINADGAESKGIELSTDWYATDNLRLRGSASFVDSQLSAPVPSLVRSISTPGFGTTFEDGMTGDRLPGSPKRQFSFFATYTQPMQNGNEVNYNLGYSWQGDVLTQTGGRGSSVTLRSFGITNASIVYKSDSWSATLFADNLFDTYAETGIRTNALYNQTVNGANVRSHFAHISPPRAVGVRIAWDFD